jgi:hypothetical protein
MLLAVVFTVHAIWQHDASLMVRTVSSAAHDRQVPAPLYPNLSRLYMLHVQARKHSSSLRMIYHRPHRQSTAFLQMLCTSQDGLSRAV